MLRTDRPSPAQRFDAFATQLAGAGLLLAIGFALLLPTTLGMLGL